MKRKFSAIFSCVLVLLLVVTAAHAQTGGSWQTLAPLPTARQELATAVLNGRIYVIGGYDGDGLSTKTVEVYNPTTNTWSAAASLPAANNHNNAAVAAGRLYSFGGNAPTAYVYDEANDSWSPVASMNFRHGETAAVGVLDDKIYVAGGGGGPRELEVYDPAHNTWTRLAPMRAGRNHCGGAFIDGKFYVVGGRDDASAPTALEAYNPQTDKWTTRAPMPTGRSGIAVGAVDGELFVFGGELPVLHGEVEAYNPMANTWRSLPKMPTPRHGIWASVIGNRIYLPGGAGDQGFAATSVNDVFTVGGKLFFDGEVSLSNGVKYLAFGGSGNVFGYYSYLSDPRYIFHFDLGYEFVFNANDGRGGLYLYDFTSGSFFFTGPSFPFPYLYDFKLNAFLYFYPDTQTPGRYTNNPRYFFNFATGQIIAK